MKMYLRGSSVEKGWETLIYIIKKWENGRNSILSTYKKAGKCTPMDSFQFPKELFLRSTHNAYSCPG
jgi:hypothetical protein